jgi:hypothetical protein
MYLLGNCDRLNSVQIQRILLAHLVGLVYVGEDTLIIVSLGCGGDNFGEFQGLVV